MSGLEDAGADDEEDDLLDEDEFFEAKLYQKRAGLHPLYPDPPSIEVPAARGSRTWRTSCTRT